MRAFDRYVHRVFAGTLLLVLLVAAILLLLGQGSWARGAVLGGAASLINLVIMAGDVRRQGPLVGDQGMKPALGRYALRMTVITAALIYSATSDRAAFWAVVPALFTSQLVMTAGEFLGSGQRE